MQARKNIVLTGFMGTGKTTVGQMVADRLGMNFADTDLMIVNRAGKSIEAIFAQDGEGVFRQLEKDVCRQMAKQNNQVIATGGGSVVDKETRLILEEHGMVICLMADIETIIRRIGGDRSRPLLGEREQIASLMERRAGIYAGLPYHIDTTGKTPDRVADEVIHLWKLK